MWNSVAKVNEFSEQTLKTVIVDNKAIMISKVGDAFYAVDAICMHKFGYLPMGSIKDSCITCPAHGAQFDLKTGKMTKGRKPKDADPNLPLIPVPDLKAYLVKVENDDVKIDV